MPGSRGDGRDRELQKLSEIVAAGFLEQNSSVGECESLSHHGRAKTIATRFVDTRTTSIGLARFRILNLDLTTAIEKGMNLLYYYMFKYTI